MPVAIPTLEEHFAARGPKRILALDGGGIRGLISLGFLERIERILRERHGNDPAFRLSHYFDLIAGTSTGSIIAALLARGQSVEEVIQACLELTEKVFHRRWWDPRSGRLHPRYNPRDLDTDLRERLGADVVIGDQERLRTGLLVMCKRIDTGGPWPISNNPKGPSFLPRPGGQGIAQRDCRLWQVVRASMAGPTFFQPETLTMSSPLSSDHKPLSGQFIDGGVSPHNNPALQAYWLATLEGFGLRWPVGPERLLILSVGAGLSAVGREAGGMAAPGGITALRSLMDDCAALVESLMQGMGHCLNTPCWQDPEVRDLRPHELVSEPRFSYARYDVKSHRDPQPRDRRNDESHWQALNLNAAPWAEMAQMDKAAVRHRLLELGRSAAESKVMADHFPSAFDLPQVAPAADPAVPTASTSTSSAAPTAWPPSFPLASEVRTYRKREGTAVTAIQLNLDVQSFTYHKWGALQSCKAGDWIVDRNGSVHTVAAESFARTYKQIGPATYVKQGVVWAAPASCDGAIATLEGATHYQKGDFLVWNDKEQNDGYAIKKDVFESLYEPAPDPAGEA